MHKKRVFFFKVETRIKANKILTSTGLISLNIDLFTDTCNCGRVKSGNCGHQVNSDIHLKTVEIQMRRFLMSRLIWISTVCLVNSFFIPIIKI